MFSKAFESPRPSAIRELFPYMSRPDMISLAGGYPSADLFDAEGLHAAMERAMQAAPSKWLQYAATEGEPPLREALAAWMGRRGIVASVDRILVTSGSGQALDLLLRVLIDRGDTILVERPSYTTALQAMRVAGAQLVGVGADADGIDVQELETRLKDLRAKALYIVPTFANPSGATLSLARRRKLLELAVRHQLIIIEDDAYGDLRFDGMPVPPLAALAKEAGAEEYVVHLSTLSKIVAPGLRVGWMLAAPEVLRRCVIAKQTSDLCTSPWIQYAAAEYLKGGVLERNVAKIVAAYRQRAQAMAQGLREQLAGKFMFSPPQGGMFIWGTLPTGVDASELLRSAIEEKVMYVPGVSFYADAPDLRSLRLCFSMTSPERIGIGIERLGVALRRATA
jgi:DNA-binding transcriptional MocR family regulator